MVPEEEKGPEKIFEEIRVENFPNMGKEIVTQVQEAQRVPYRINPRRNMTAYQVFCKEYRVNINAEQPGLGEYSQEQPVRYRQ